MLKLRSLGINDYAVLDGRQRIGRIRFADERIPPVWLWAVTIHLPGGLPTGSAQDFSTAKAQFKAGLGGTEGQDHAGATRVGLQGDEHQGR